MEISVAEARAVIVRHYESKGYSHKHAETHVPHDPEQVFRIFKIVQEQEENKPAGSQGEMEPAGSFLSRSKWNWTTLGKVV